MIAAELILALAGALKSLQQRFNFSTAAPYSFRFRFRLRFHLPNHNPIRALRIDAGKELLRLSQRYYV